MNETWTYNDFAAVHNDAGELICTVADMQPEEQMRVGELVAAAPALLAALEALVSAPLRYNGNCIEIDCASHSDAMERVRIARLAIALATGSAAKGGAK